MPTPFRFALTVTLFGACAVVLPATLQSKGEPAKSDAERLRGTWIHVPVEVDGNKPFNKKPVTKDGVKPLVKKKSFEGQTITFQGGKFEIKRGDTVIQAGTHKLDPSKNPKLIDITVTEGEGKGVVQLGIYELEGYVLTACFDPQGKKRPTELKTTAGSGHVLVTMHRDIEREVDPFDASVVYKWQGRKSMNGLYKSYKGEIYDKTALSVEPKATVVLPDKATEIGRHEQAGVLLIYMLKSPSLLQYGMRLKSIAVHRDGMGCAAKLEKGALLIGTFGEFSALETSRSMALLVLVPPNVEVERRAGLIGGYGGRSGTELPMGAIGPTKGDPKPALTKTKKGAPDVWLPPTVEDGWPAIPAVPDFERRVGKGV
jgi:uncharacterized protein (TIGR03067 family)